MIDIKKITLAGVSWLLLYPKQIAKASVAPIIFMLPLGFELQSIIGQFDPQSKLNTLPDTSLSLLVYLMLALLGYSLLAANIYRLVILGGTGIGQLGLTRIKQFPKFIATFIMIQLLLGLPVMLTGQPILVLVIYMFIAPLVINLPRLALSETKKTYTLDFATRLRLTILQIVIPSSLLIVLNLLLPQGTFYVLVSLLFKFVLNYWELVTLALAYQQIDQFSIPSSRA